MPAKPRWLLSIPDDISQLEQLDRTPLTRRDSERLFGVSKARAATPGWLPGLPTIEVGGGTVRGGGPDRLPHHLPQPRQMA
ncbi:MAG: hypothetical protein OXG35_33170 [Acidobacteria bacterium]|nr:hypothetical protein [Acidobacteriota bacterium]